MEVGKKPEYVDLENVHMPKQDLYFAFNGKEEL